MSDLLAYREQAKEIINRTHGVDTYEGNCGRAWESVWKALWQVQPDLCAENLVHMNAAEIAVAWVLKYGEAKASAIEKDENIAISEVGITLTPPEGKLPTVYPQLILLALKAGFYDGFTSASPPTEWDDGDLVCSPEQLRAFYSLVEEAIKGAKDEEKSEQKETVSPVQLECVFHAYYRADPYLATTPAKINALNWARANLLVTSRVSGDAYTWMLELTDKGRNYVHNVLVVKP